MRYKSFRIQNFKGIKDTIVDLSSLGGANVFPFVGLNESGKTTLLEAIHSFSPDTATSKLLGGDVGIGVPYKKRVPRHLISTFTGIVSVSATLLLTEEDFLLVSDDLRTLDFEVDLQRLPKEVVFERQQRFKSGDFIENSFILKTEFFVRDKAQKGRKAKNWRAPISEEQDKIRDSIYNYTPDIAYFPTFVFDFPARTYLTQRGGIVDAFYRSVFQDILDYDGQGHIIEQDIVRRVRDAKLVVPWLSFLAAWSGHDDKAKIQHVMDRASAAVSKLIFGRWNQIFGENTKGKEVIISYEIVEGEKVDSAGNKMKTEEHDVYITFQIRDGTRRFNINDRSLGFRWFFAFMLFTQCRVARWDTRPLLFLFDEPAANLHAAAQQKLIDSFPEIAKGEHMLAYSTHSHYMIEPKWLEQTFIVTNRADAPLSSILDDISLEDESLDIKAATYRSFVNANPGKTSYFQPILDRLEVVPSRLDILKDSIVVEGKSDYYILRYANKLVVGDELPLLPGLGAGTFGALAALQVGWNLNFLFLLDGDRQGKIEKAKYSSEFGVEQSRLTSLNELFNSDTKVKVIEDLLDSTALHFIQTDLALARHPTKAEITRFFQERLAMDRIESISQAFRDRATSVIEALRGGLKQAKGR